MPLAANVDCIAGLVNSSGAAMETKIPPSAP
jgi:hypothetical protein